MERVICPQPSRNRVDDRVVEVFLHAFEQGRFAQNLRWLPQHENNVEVIATSITDGRTLAIEHTRLFAFDDHMEQEALLRPIAERLECIRFSELSRKWVQVFFQPKFIGRLLKRHSSLVQNELVRFLTLNLPTMPPGRLHHFVVPIPLPGGKQPTVELDVEVWDNMDLQRPICVSGVLPDRTLDSQVRRALENKLQKLVDASADLRFLLIDIPTHTHSEIAVATVIIGLQAEFPLLSKVDEIVFAKTFAFESEGYIFFRLWNPRLQVWSDHIVATVEKPPLSA